LADNRTKSTPNIPWAEKEGGGVCLPLQRKGTTGFHDLLKTMPPSLFMSLRLCSTSIAPRGLAERMLVSCSWMRCLWFDLCVRHSRFFGLLWPRLPVCSVIGHTILTYSRLHLFPELFIGSFYPSRSDNRFVSKRRETNAH
jgi:hypothetical protein